MPVTSQGSEPALRGAKLHPLLTAAAVAVIVFAAAGIAVMFGWLPSPFAPRPAEVSMLDAFPPPPPTDQLTPLSAPPSTASTAPAATSSPALTPPPVSTRPVVRSEPVRHHATTSRPREVPPPAPVLAAQPMPTPAPAARRRCNDCGVIESIQEIKTPGEGTGLGGVAGGVLGGVLGNQVGGGNGRKAMTVLGAVGGALAGNQIERHTRAQTRYEITVRMNDGSSRVLSRENPPAWREGDRVRVEGDQLFETNDR